MIGTRCGEMAPAKQRGVGSRVLDDAVVQNVGQLAPDIGAIDGRIRVRQVQPKEQTAEQRQPEDRQPDDPRAVQCIKW